MGGASARKGHRTTSQSGHRSKVRGDIPVNISGPMMGLTRGQRLRLPVTFPVMTQNINHP